MRCVIQKAIDASCIVDRKEISKIDKGLMVLVGFTDGDDLEKIRWMAKKIVNLRIFEDENSIMNKSVLDEKGKILSISQFTLYADSTKGNRPSYIKALGGEESSKLYDLFNKELEKYVDVSTGIFGEDMNIKFTNVGPTTIILER